MALLCKANGRSVIQEKIFENRFTHIGELKRLGAKISIIKNKAIIKGNSNFEGAELMSSDLRASVALVIAAIVSKGNSIINRIYHLDRGYENIENKLKKVGVKIKDFLMAKKYFKKIIAQSPQDLQVISACCEGGKIKIDEIKYLPKNKIFLFLIERIAREKRKFKRKS